MAITPRSKGLGNIGSIVNRQRQAAPTRPVPKPAPKLAPATTSRNPFAGGKTTTMAQRQASQPFRSATKPVNKIDPMQAQYDQMKNVPMAPPPGGAQMMPFNPGQNPFVRPVERGGALSTSPGLVPESQQFITDIEYGPGLVPESQPFNPNPNPGQQPGFGDIFGGGYNPFGRGVIGPKKFDPSMGGSQNLYDEYSRQRQRDGMLMYVKQPGQEYGGGYANWLKSQQNQQYDPTQDSSLNFQNSDQYKAYQNDPTYRAIDQRGAPEGYKPVGYDQDPEQWHRNQDLMRAYEDPIRKQNQINMDLETRYRNDWANQQRSNPNAPKTMYDYYNNRSMPNQQGPGQFFGGAMNDVINPFDPRYNDQQGGGIYGNIIGRNMFDPNASMNPNNSAFQTFGAPTVDAGGPAGMQPGQMFGGQTPMPNSFDDSEIRRNAPSYNGGINGIAGLFGNPNPTIPSDYDTLEGSAFNTNPSNSGGFMGGNSSGSLFGGGGFSGR